VFCAILASCCPKPVTVEPKVVEPCHTDWTAPTERFPRSARATALNNALRECVGPATLPDDRFEKRCDALSTMVERSMCRGVCEPEHLRFVAEVSSCVSTVAVNLAAPPTCFHAEASWRKLCETRCAEEVAAKGPPARP